MKKLTALILSLVLALSFSMTAFAVAEVGADGAAGNGGATEVTVEIDSSNISVTVPLSFTIVAKVDGGDATVPSNYKIKNSSLIPVKVDTIAVVNNNPTDWALKGTAIAANAAPTGTGVNDLFLSINGQVMAVQTATAPTTPASWDIAAAGELNLAILASTSRLDQTTAATNLITITYVISAK